MYEHLWVIFLWYPHAMTFLIFLDIFTLKTFILHAVYVGFPLPGTLKLLHYALLDTHTHTHHTHTHTHTHIYIYIYILRADI